MKKPKKKVKSPKKAKPALTKPPAPVVDTVPADQLKAMAAKAKASIAYARQLFPKLSTLSDEERGRWQGLSDDEESAARGLLDDKRAPADLRDRLARRAALLDVADGLKALLEEVEDTARLLGELVRPALRAAGEQAAE